LVAPKVFIRFCGAIPLDARHSADTVPNLENGRILGFPLKCKVSAFQYNPEHW
jgi:hypothetical protein